MPIFQRVHFHLGLNSLMWDIGILAWNMEVVVNESDPRVKSFIILVAYGVSQVRCTVMFTYFASVSFLVCSVSFQGELWVNHAAH